tara:strand:- start:59 stop:445 length:387 start_codon:yes stop_codon:yes gene_type:complete
MSNFLKKNKDFFLLSIFTIALFAVHLGLKTEYFFLNKIPLNSIYLFNYFAIVVFLVSSKLNIAYKLASPLTFFVLLTFIKTLATIVFFIHYNNDKSYDIAVVIYNFFPVYFLLLTFEVISLKKTLRNI